MRGILACLLGSAIALAMPGLAAATTAPDLSATLTHSPNGSGHTEAPGSTWTWRVKITETGGTASFTNGQRIFTDFLPQGPTYGTPVVSETNISGSLDCSIDSGELACNANGDVNISPGTFYIDFTVTTSTPGGYVNPHSAEDVCAVDPDNHVTESNESNNDCAETVYVADPPTAALTSPANGAKYPQTRVPAQYSCQDGVGGPGIAYCGQLPSGATSGSHFRVPGPGPQSFTVRARSKDGLITDVTHTFTAMAPPTATITAPASGGTYKQGQSVATSFTCAEGAYGPGLKRCLDATGSGAPGGHLNTSRAGSFNYRVTATSKDGQTFTTHIHYTVLPSTKFKISHVRVHPDGVVQFDIAVPDPGRIGVLETASKSDEVKTAVALQQNPTKGRFVFARKHITLKSPATLHVTVTPNARGKRLLKHHRHTVRIRLWVLYQPSSGHSHSGRYGLFVTK
jgi:hypothetical protein